MSTSITALVPDSIAPVAATNSISRPVIAPGGPTGTFGAVTVSVCGGPAVRMKYVMFACVAPAGHENVVPKPSKSTLSVKKPTSLNVRVRTPTSDWLVAVNCIVVTSPAAMRSGEKFLTAETSTAGGVMT